MNLTISDFQKISNGSFNAGDITLTSSGKLDKVNNHVGILKGLNTKSISAATTLEVKNAFVQALKNAGVDEAALAGVREELGLPQSGDTKGFDLLSLKPLSRAQTREILDRFAGVINEKAKDTVVSNKWDALKAADIVRYKNILARAAEVNEQSAATRAAAQRKLAFDIVNYGAGEIPSNIRKSATYRNLSEVDKNTFAKTMAYIMFFRGGADVDSIAAEAMKNVLMAKYGNGIKNEAERDLFKGLALSRPATTDLARIEQDMKDAKKAAAAGVKLEYGSEGKEMKEVADYLRNFGGLGFYVNKTAEKSTSKNFVAKLANDISGNTAFLKEIVAKFGSHVKDLGTLELGGAPDCKITQLKNGNAELLFTIKAGTAGNKAFNGDCCLKIEVDPKDKSIQKTECAMKLEPPRFTFNDSKPAESQKMQILGNIKNLGTTKDSPFTDEEMKSAADQMSKWQNMRPGQMKNFEKWLANDLDKYVNNCIAGIDQTGNQALMTFDERGIASQFRDDNYRSQVTIGNRTYAPQGFENKEINNEICRVLPNIADRKFITGLMNQSSVATMVYLYVNAPDPQKEKDPDAQPLRIMDPAGEHVANFDMNRGDPIEIAQPRNLEESQYELKIDNNSKTATITLRQSYHIKVGQTMHEGLFAMDGYGGQKVGTVQYSYQINVSGLGSGNPHIASVDFGQEIRAEDM